MGAAVLAALGALLVCGCEARITEVVVVVDSELRVPVDIDAIALRVNTTGRVVPGLDAPLTGPDAVSLPLTLGLRSESDAATSFSVVVRGLRAGGERIRAEVATRFVPGERRVLRIRLESACLGVMCADGETCRDAECRPVAVDPQFLPPLSSLDLGVGPGPRDAGTDLGPRDAEPPDAGDVDAGDIDAGVMDAGDVDAGAMDAGCVAGDAGVVGAPPGCMLAKPPARPLCADDGMDVGAQHFALRDVVLDQSGDRWRTLGWDLDGNCTDALASMPATECVPPAAPAPTDGLSGIDNVFGATISAQFIAYQPELATATALAVENGRNVPLVYLENWNGLPDDPRVTVSMAFAVDLVPAGTPIPAGGVTYSNMLPPPRWDGTDTAYVSSSVFPLPGRSVLYDDNAWVAGGMIVARLPDRADVDLPGGLGAVRIQLTDLRLTARIAAAGAGAYALSDVLLTGRWPQSDLSRFLDQIGVCPGSPTTDLVRTGFGVVLTRAMDVRATPGTGGPGVLCDAVSTAIPFENGVSVTLGDMVPVELTPYECP
jgi:hypothetical protein